MPKLAIKEYCTGCTACASVCPKSCIAMTADQDGFLYPLVDLEGCVNCGLCEKVCPVSNPLKISGDVPKAYAAYSQNEVVRMQSSSGGVFTEIAKETIGNGGAVYGAAYNERFEVVHICAKTEEDLAKLRGAKYAQSNLSGVFEEIKARLDFGQQVLFSGTPCQVQGLRTFLRRDYENLLLLDLVCHSVPSPLVWKKYLEYISNGKKLASVNLRCKDSGWSHYSYSNRFDFSDGTFRLDRSSESLYMKLFGGGYITRPACANCPAKGYSRVSDLTLGDFWGVWDIIPELDDNKGTSLLLVQSVRGVELLAQVSDRIVLKEVSLEEASQQNPAMIRTAHVHSKHGEVMQMIRAGNIASAQKLIEKLTRRKPSILRWVARKVWRLIRR